MRAVCGAGFVCLELAEGESRSPSSSSSSSASSEEDEDWELVDEDWELVGAFLGARHDTARVIVDMCDAKKEDIANTQRTCNLHCSASCISRSIHSNSAAGERTRANIACTNHSGNTVVNVHREFTPNIKSPIGSIAPYTIATELTQLRIDAHKHRQTGETSAGWGRLRVYLAQRLDSV